MRPALALALLLAAAGASAQTGAAPPALSVRPAVTLSLGTLYDSGDGALLAAQLSVGARRGVVTGRVRGTVASSWAFLGDTRERWEVAALGGVALGRLAQVFLGAGPGVTGGSKRPSRFLSWGPCETRVSPRVLGLALALDATLRTPGIARVGIQAWANANRHNPVGGGGGVIGIGGP